MTKGRNFDYAKPVRGRMAKAALWQMEEDAKLLRQALRDDDSLPGWVDLYLATSADRLGTASKYMQYQIKFQPASASDLASADLAGAAGSDLEGWWEDYAPQMMQNAASGWSQGAAWAAGTAKDVVQEQILPYAPTPLAQLGGAKLSAQAAYTLPDSVELAKTPKSVRAAYGMAMYWLDLAIKRANYDGNAVASSQLLGLYKTIEAEMPELGVKDVACEVAGIGCKKRGRAAVIEFAHNAVKISKLADADKDKILPILNHAWRSVKIQEVAPFVLVGGGAAAAVWFMKRHYARR
jgi:hypothetical protein